MTIFSFHCMICFYLLSLTEGNNAVGISITINEPFLPILGQATDKLTAAVSQSFQNTVSVINKVILKSRKIPLVHNYRLILLEFHTEYHSYNTVFWSIFHMESPWLLQQHFSRIRRLTGRYDKNKMWSRYNGVNFLLKQYSLSPPRRLGYESSFYLKVSSVFCFKSLFCHMQCCVVLDRFIAVSHRNWYNAL